MRLYVSADIEGIVGVATPEQTTVSGFEYESARRWMTRSVASVAEAARAEGVEEVVVADSHGSAENLLLDELPEYVRVVRALPRPLSMMQGVDEGEYVGAMLIGHHAGSTNLSGTLAHTFRSDTLREVKLNGKTVNEAEVCALIAGHFGVPVLMISGDDIFSEECKQNFPHAEFASVKKSLGHRSVITLTPNVAYQVIHESCKNALRRRDDMFPMKIEGEITIEMEFKYRLAVEYLCFLPFFERAGAFGVRYVAENVLVAARIMSFVLGYNSSLK